MKLMKFNYRGGGGFMGIEEDMVVEDTGHSNRTDMAWVLVRDERTRHFGEGFYAYPDELSAMVTCPMETMIWNTGSTTRAA